MNKLLPLLLVAAAAGFVGVVAGGALRPGEPSPAAPEAPKDRRVDVLIAAVDRLSERLDEIEISREPAPTAGSNYSEPAVRPHPIAMSEVPQADADASAAEPGDEASETRKMRVAARSAVAESRREDMQTMGERIQNRQSAALDTFARKHGLNTWQREEMGKSLRKRLEAGVQLMQKLVTPGPDGKRPSQEKIQEEWEKLVAETDEEIAEALTPEQFEAFERERSEIPGATSDH